MGLILWISRGLRRRCAGKQLHNVNRTPEISMLRCLFTNIVSDFSRSNIHGKWTKSRHLPVVTGLFYSTQATKMELSSAADKRYQAAIAALNGLQSNLQNLAIRDDPKSKISSTIKFLERVGVSLDDLDKLSIIHVSGTKGKGSTCAMAESILRHHQYKTGFFSSPHLVEVRERIQINGQPISRELFSTYFWEVYGKLTKTAAVHNDEMPFYFAFLTVMAFHVFLKENVDVAVMEVGIGGEYDTTNVVQKPVVCGVTSLGLDHVSVLGDTIEKIAWQKGGIFKKGVPAVTMPQDKSSLKVLLDRANKIGCPLYMTPELSQHKITTQDSDFHLGLMGRVQEKNAALALQLCKIWLARQNSDKLYQEMSQPLKHSDLDHIPVLDAYYVDNKCKQALQHCSWRGRNQILRKPGVTYFIDGAHTKESLEQCIEWFQEEAAREAEFISGKVVKILLFNMTGDRDIEARLNQLKDCTFDHVIFSPNYLYVDSSSADLVKKSVTQENQLNRCFMMKEIWDQRIRPISTKSQVKHPQVQFMEELGQLPVVPVELETVGLESSSPSLKSVPVPSSVISCLSETLYWATQGRDLSLPGHQMPSNIPEYLTSARRIQILVTGSIHLVGGVLKLVEPVVSDGENQSITS